MCWNVLCKVGEAGSGVLGEQGRESSAERINNVFRVKRVRRPEKWCLNGEKQMQNREWPEQSL